MILNPIDKLSFPKCDEELDLLRKMNFAHQLNKTTQPPRE